MRFANPWVLLALFALPFWARHYIKSRAATRHSVRFSDIGSITKLASYRNPLAVHSPFILRIVAAALIIIAIARPQTGFSEEEIISKGIDIMLTLDLSSSMSATDLAPSRIAAAKRVIGKFVQGRKNDRIGLVVFAAAGYTQCPLTLDYPVLQKFLVRSKIGLIEDGTAIGLALATASNRLKDSTAKSKIAILLTDGVNNRGAIDPITAAQMAKAVDVKVYTIGVGREGTYMQTIDDPVYGKQRVPARTEIDEKLLQQIAETTGGQYFRAEDESTLLAIYEHINKLEKTDIKSKVYMRYSDWFMYLLAPALALIMLELLMPVTRWSTLP